ncbi:MAG: hypothetical protein ACYTES_14270, partial [Planctomycetota bacterium]
AHHRHGHILEKVIQMVERRLVRQQDRRDPPTVLGPQRVHRFPVAVHGTSNDVFLSWELRTGGHD